MTTLFLCFCTLFSWVDSAESGLTVSSGYEMEGSLFKLYKDHISVIDGNRCTMLPSCSRYAKEAVAAHGWLLGGIMACDRLVRCGRSETKLAYQGKVKSHGRYLTRDSLSDNDFWWYHTPPLLAKPGNAREPATTGHEPFDFVPSQNAITIDAEMQFRYAQALFDQSRYDVAIVEWSRFIHFFSSDVRHQEAIFKLGMSQYQLKRFSGALKTFISLIEEGDDDALAWGKQGHSEPEKVVAHPKNSISIDAHFMISTTYLAMDRYASAEATLQNLLMINESNRKKTEKYSQKSDGLKSIESYREIIADHTYYALAWIYLGRAEKKDDSVIGKIKTLRKALTYLEHLSPSGTKKYHTFSLESTIDGSITTLLDGSKNPVLGGLFSIIPGGGFAYCRRYHDALASLLINGALLFASAKAFDDGNGALGGLLASIEFGFYSGNIYGGISSVHKYNQHLLESSMAAYRQKSAEDLKQIPLLPFEISYHPDRLEPANGGRGRASDKERSAIKVPLFSVHLPF